MKGELQNEKVLVRGKEVFIGVDVHKESWHVTARVEEAKRAVDESSRLENPHFFAPQAHPEKTKDAQSIEIMPLPAYMVPKGGLEPPQGLLLTRP